MEELPLLEVIRTAIDDASRDPDLAADGYTQEDVERLRDRAFGILTNVAEAARRAAIEAEHEEIARRARNQIVAVDPIAARAKNRT